MVLLLRVDPCGGEQTLTHNMQPRQMARTAASKNTRTHLIITFRMERDNPADNAVLFLATKQKMIDCLDVAV